MIANHIRWTLIMACQACFLPLQGGVANSAEWGTLRGRMVYDGQIPPPRRLKITSDKAYCEKFHPVDESLVVAGDGGLANVAIWIRVKRGQQSVLPANYRSRLKQPVVLDNPECRFDPHVLTVLVGQTLVIKNPDPIGQSAKVDCVRNPPINVMIPPGRELSVVLSLAESLPVPVSCGIHPWESAYLIVRNDPCMAVSAKDGTFEIRDIPVGTHELQFWHERVGYLKEARFGGGVTDRRGRVTIAVRNAVEDLGTVRVDSATLRGK